MAPEATRYRRLLLGEIQRVWGLWQDPGVFFGQVHQESRFKATARSSHAAGIGQFTPPTAADMQQWYPQDLRELCTEQGGCALDPRWGLRALVLYDRRLWLGSAYAMDAEQRLAFMLVKYNGGSGWLERERKAAIERGIESTAWFGAVERVCARGPAACDESRGYPRLILYRWRPVYRAWLGPGH